MSLIRRDGMDNIHSMRLFRWFLLLWIGLLYMRELVLGSSPTDRTDVRSWIFFTILLIVHISLYWISLSHLMQRRWYVFYFIGQGLILLGLGLVLRNPNVIINVYLALTVETITLLQRPWSVSLVAGIYLLLTLFSINLSLEGEWVRLRNTQDLAFQLLFIVGCVVLYIQQARAHAQLTSYAMRVEELTLVTERQRMARELHDTLAQGLTGLILQLEVVNAHQTQRHYERAQEIVRDMMVSARATLGEARRAIEDLRLEEITPQRLLEVVQEEVDRFSLSTGIHCICDLAVLVELSPHLCEHVLRTIREGLINVACHARAQMVSIKASRKKNMIEVEIYDNGVGFDPSLIPSQVGHYGLLGLRERARLSGGHLEIVSTPGRGTMIRLRVPACPVEEHKEGSRPGILSLKQYTGRNV